MANLGDRGVFSGIKQADALTRWEGLVRRFPSYLKSQMSYVDFQRAWRNDNRIPLDAWDTYCQAFDLDPRTGNKKHAESKQDDHGDDWDEGEEKEEKKEEKDKGKADDENKNALDQSELQEAEDGENAKKQKQDTARVKSVVQPNRPLTRDEIEGLNMVYRPPAPTPTPPPQGELATPIRPQYIPPASRGYGSRTYEEDTQPVTTSRPWRRNVRPKRPRGGIEEMIRKMFKPNARNAVQAVGRGFFASPVGIVVILILVFVIVAAFVLLKISPFGGDSGRQQVVVPVVPVVPGDGNGNVPGIPGMSLVTTVPSDTLERNEPVTFTITAIYSGDLDVTVYNPIAPNADYVSSTPEGGQYDEVSRTRSWRLNEVTPVSTNGDERTYVFTITLRPAEALGDVPRVTIRNRAFATAAAPVVAPGNPPNLDASTFEELVAGQGRNTGILGNEDEFVEAIFANTQPVRFASGGGRDAYEPYIRDLYRVAVSNNINPVIMLTIWGVEQSLGIVNGLEFGCDLNNPEARGFANQVQCSADTLNTHMNDFDTKAAQGLPVYYNPSWATNKDCDFYDAFAYAYEAYTPVCSMSHGNDEARTNFQIYFKEFLGR